mmetsp:Transcript_41209/g.106704  ORF Transcript_41209/g.106704 Transcript_41209/m.106704 type:complete len:201 (-) Transcript_41209:811-1413(-)
MLALKQEHEVAGALGGESGVCQVEAVQPISGKLHGLQATAAGRSQLPQLPAVAPQGGHRAAARHVQSLQVRVRGEQHAPHGGAAVDVEAAQLGRARSEALQACGGDVVALLHVEARQGRALHLQPEVQQAPAQRHRQLLQAVAVARQRLQALAAGGVQQPQVGRRDHQALDTSLPMRTSALPPRLSASVSKIGTLSFSGA